MRASPARIMATIRAEHGLSVQDAWFVYRDLRDYLKRDGEKPSLAAVARNAERVEAVAMSAKAPQDDWFDYYEGESAEWEITGIYGD